jgi:hypothetical protein
MKSAQLQPDFRTLAEFRYQIRRFLHFSDVAAERVGIEPQQHQLLLALKGLRSAGPEFVALLQSLAQNAAGPRSSPGIKNGK